MEADVKKQREFLGQLAQMFHPWWESLEKKTLTGEISSHKSIPEFE
jgi:hypothetical protein